MDPLYDNYDKRQKALEEKSAPKPQPTLNSMPVFGAAAQKEVESDNSQKTNTEPVAPSQETVINLHENTEAASTVANSVSENVAQPVTQPAETVISNAQTTDVLSAQPAQNLAAQPVQTPVMNQASNMSQASNMNQTSNMSQVADQNLAANMPGQTPMMQPQEASFEQQFAQMVDGVKPAQLGTQQPFNPGYTGTGDIILNLDQPKKKKDPKVIALIVGVVLLVIASIALLILSGTKNSEQKQVKSSREDIIEYFVYGTKKKNSINESTYKIDSSDYVFTNDAVSLYGEINFDYVKKLTDMIASNSAFNDEKIIQYIEAYVNSRAIITNIALRGEEELKILSQLASKDEEDDILAAINNVSIDYIEQKDEFLDKYEGRCSNETEKDGYMRCLDDQMTYSDYYEDLISERNYVERINNIILNNIIQTIMGKHDEK